MSEDKDLCTHLRQKRKQGFSYETLDKNHPIDITEILNHITGECGSESSEEKPIDTEDDEPWTEEYVLEKLYLDKEMQFTEISNLLNCHSGTVTKYVDKFGVSPIESSNRTSSPRVNRIQRIGKERDEDSDT